VAPERSRGNVRKLLEKQEVDAVTFTSSSTVSNFVEMMGKGEAAALLRTVLVACIGPITARTARDAGIIPDVVADPYTIEGLVESLVRELPARPHASK